MPAIHAVCVMSLGTHMSVMGVESSQIMSVMKNDGIGDEKGNGTTCLFQYISSFSCHGTICLLQ